MIPTWCCSVGRSSGINGASLRGCRSSYKCLIGICYLVRCHDGSLYTGISTYVARRFAQHRGEGGAGSKYLKGRSPLALVFQKNLGSKSLAFKVERKVKKLSKARKEELIRIYGFATVKGAFYDDALSDWWAFKHAADIQSVRRHVPKSLLVRTLGKRSVLQTLHQIHGEGFEQLESQLRLSNE